MPPTSVPKPGRLLAIILVITAGILALMPLTGATKPRLGLDLQGGTSVTLKPRVIDGANGKITNKILSEAVNVIRKRVDAIGVAEADVKTEGKNIVISVPGKGRDQVLETVGSTAELRFRHVLAAANGVPAPAVTPSATPSSTKSPAAVKPSPTATAKKRAVPQGLLAAPLPKATTTPGASTTPAPTPSASASASASPGSVVGLSGGSDQQLLAAFATLDCSDEETRRIAPLPDNPNHKIISCSEDGATKYLLDKAAVLGKEIKSASAGLDTQGSGEWVVDVNFRSNGRKQFAAVTAKAAKLPDVTTGCQPPDGCNAVAVVLDGQVVSAPRITPTEGILGGQATISGGPFTEAEAENLANVLKFGALPLAFDRQQLVSVSATLGRDQLHAGLIAGGIGLLAVILFSLVYYRGLGLVTIASLGLAAAITFGLVSLLGKWISFTLSLAGIAGLIVAIGITADSFIVYFERLRDEVREGKTLRSAAERGWQRAKRTILVADGVSFLAAVVLYILSIGSVRGFAFTLGLSTLIDVLLVFLFTYPVITLLVRTRAFGSGRPWTGMSPDRLGAKAGAEPASGGRPVRAHRAGQGE